MIGVGLLARIVRCISLLGAVGHLVAAEVRCGVELKLRQADV